MEWEESNKTYYIVKDPEGNLKYYSEGNKTYYNVKDPEGNLKYYIPPEISETEEYKDFIKQQEADQKRILNCFLTFWITKMNMLLKSAEDLHKEAEHGARSYGQN